MSGIHQSVVLDVCRLQTTFVDGVGNIKLISGTGFWLHNDGKQFFISNKHNIDPTLKLGSHSGYRFYKLDVELRAYNGSVPTFQTKFFELDQKQSQIILHPSADAALICKPRFIDLHPKFRWGNVLSVSDLATPEFFNDKLALMDMASFIGYAGNKQSQWWDQVWKLGIARSVNLASLPGIPFTHGDLMTTDAVLVAGLAFSGSSGSVVLSHEKSFKVGDGLLNPNYVPPRVIGIMSGHWWEPTAAPGLFAHSGMSYFTRSTAILSLLAQA